MIKKSNSQKLREKIKAFVIDELDFTFTDMTTLKLYDDNTGLEPSYTGLNDTNSPRAYIDLGGISFEYTRLPKAKGYEYGIKFVTILELPNGTLKTIDCFTILFKDNFHLQRKQQPINKFILHSSFFVIENTLNVGFSVLEFVQSYIDISKTKMVRLDICIDIPYKIDFIIKHLFPTVDFYSQIGKDTKCVGYNQTYYTKELQRTNRNHTIRIYDKVLDTYKKGKGHLFPHLSEYKDMKRIELELRSETCYRIDYSIEQILENKDNIISKLFCKYFNTYSSIPLAHEELTLIPYENKPSRLKETYLSVGHIPDGYLSRVNGYLKNVKENTGYRGFIQTVVGHYFDNPKKRTNVQYIDTQTKQRKEHIKYHTERNPEELLTELLNYYKTELNIPQHKLNNILRPYVKTPILKLKR